MYYGFKDVRYQPLLSDSSDLLDGISIIRGGSNTILNESLL